MFSSVLRSPTSSITPRLDVDPGNFVCRLFFTGCGADVGHARSAHSAHDLINCCVIGVGKVAQRCPARGLSPGELRVFVYHSHRLRSRVELNQRAIGRRVLNRSAASLMLLILTMSARVRCGAEVIRVEPNACVNTVAALINPLVSPIP